MIVNVIAAAKYFKHMQITNANTAAVSATSKLDLEAAVMTKHDFKSEKLYQTTMSIAKKLLLDGIISADEYRQIDTIFLDKYKPVFGTLFSDISLTSEPKRVIYSS